MARPWSEAVLLLGHPATGKSTVAWCLLEQGWRLLSSELTVVDAGCVPWSGVNPEACYLIGDQ